MNVKPVQSNTQVTAAVPLFAREDEIARALDQQTFPFKWTTETIVENGVTRYVDGISPASDETSDGVTLAVFRARPHDVAPLIARIITAGPIVLARLRDDFEGSLPIGSPVTIEAGSFSAGAPAFIVPGAPLGFTLSRIVGRLVGEASEARPRTDLLPIELAPGIGVLPPASPWPDPTLNISLPASAAAKTGTVTVYPGPNVGDFADVEVHTNLWDVLVPHFGACATWMGHHVVTRKRIFQTAGSVQVYEGAPNSGVALAKVDIIPLSLELNGSNDAEIPGPDEFEGAVSRRAIIRVTRLSLAVAFDYVEVSYGWMGVGMGVRPLITPPVT